MSRLLFAAARGARIQTWAGVLTGYYCVICGKFLPADEHGVIVHDDVPHPVDMDFGDEEKPQ